MNCPRCNGLGILGIKNGDDDIQCPDCGGEGGIAIDQSKLAEILDHKLVGYEHYGILILIAELGNGVSIEIKLDDGKMPVGMHKAKQEAADYIAAKFFDALINGENY